MKNIVIIGGGTGTTPLIKGIKDINDIILINITGCIYLYRANGLNMHTITIVANAEKDVANVNIKILFMYLCLNIINIDDIININIVNITKNIVFISRETS